MEQQQPKQPNKDYIIQSLQMQMSNHPMEIANRDAVITEQYQEIEELKKSLEEYRNKELEEMDKGGKTNDKK